MRRIVVALIPLILAVSASAQSQKDQPREKQPEAQITQQERAPDQRGTDQSPLTVKIIPTPKTDADREEEAKDRREKAETDRKLADYTGELAFFTEGLFIATVILCIATVGLLFAAVFQSRDMKASIAAAQRNAEAANKSAVIAETALLKLERPFVFVKEITIDAERGLSWRAASGEIIPGAIITANLSAVFENSGQTPAVKVIYNFNCANIGPLEAEKFMLSDKGLPSRAVIGPKAVLQTVPKPLSARTLQEMADKKENWFLWGWIDYDDIFPNSPRHRTEFCFSIIATKTPMGEIFLRFPPHDEGNATDDDCRHKPSPYKAEPKSTVPLAAVVIDAVAELKKTTP